MNAIFQFENHLNVALEFRLKYLVPKLTDSKLNNDTEIVFVDYLDESRAGVPMRKPTDVAKEAAERWSSEDPRFATTVWIWDLDAAGRDNPDSSYGICVMLSLADALGMSFTDFLASPHHLNIISTLYAGNLPEDHGMEEMQTSFRDLSVAKEAWPKITKLKKDPHSPVEDQVMLTQLGLRQPGGRVIMANSKIDEWWMSEVIIEWLKGH